MEIKYQLKAIYKMPTQDTGGGSQYLEENLLKI
jgi:hypothetical protein